MLISVIKLYTNKKADIEKQEAEKIKKMSDNSDIADTIKAPKNNVDNNNNIVVNIFINLF